jgi:hypothetical protein
MNFGRSQYPDISDILQRKVEGRRDLASLTFGEKIEMLEVMRDRIAPLKNARDTRDADQPACA